jgi:hypothetical protein
LLGEAGVNIEALAGWHANGDGSIRVIVDDPDRARQVFEEAGLRFAERTVLTASLANRPGALAVLSSQLADAAIDIEAIYVLGGNSESLEVAICVDEAESAAEVLAG